MARKKIYIYLDYVQIAWPPHHRTFGQVKAEYSWGLIVCEIAVLNIFVAGP